MTVNKNFLEAVSKDSALQEEVEHAALEALCELLKAKGLEEDAAKITEAALEKVAEAHEFKSDEMVELSEDELEAVAGGGGGCGCSGIGGGGGSGLVWGCVIYGNGSINGCHVFDENVRCQCIGHGVGIYIE